MRPGMPVIYSESSNAASMAFSANLFRLHGGVRSSIRRMSAPGATMYPARRPARLKNLVRLRDTHRFSLMSERQLSSCWPLQKSMNASSTSISAPGPRAPVSSRISTRVNSLPVGLFTRVEILELTGALGPGALMLVDEAFMDFCSGQHELSCLSDISENLWVSRSLTKFFSLAGLR